MTDTPTTGPISSEPAPELDVAPEAPVPAGNPLRHTRTGGVWTGVIVFAVVLILMLIFILQNTQSVQISYFGATGHLSLAVAMLLAAVAGIVLTAVAGSLRIWQLRRKLRRAVKH
jgi:uncharacterized integral membrane protein